MDEQKSSGALRIFNYPLSRGNYNDYIGHDFKGIECVLISKEDKYIISLGKDGCIMVFEIKDLNAKIEKYRDGY